MDDFTIKSNVKDVEEALQTKLEQVLEIWGEVAVGHAQIYCPVDTGNLQGSIDFEVDAEGWFEGEPAVFIGTNVEYAQYVEEGTSKQKAQPYLKPAIENHVDEYQKAAEQILKG